MALLLLLELALHLANDCASSSSNSSRHVMLLIKSLLGSFILGPPQQQLFQHSRQTDLVLMDLLQLRILVLALNASNGVEAYNNNSSCRDRMRSCRSHQLLTVQQQQVVVV